MRYGLREECESVRCRSEVLGWAMDVWYVRNLGT